MKRKNFLIGFTSSIILLLLIFDPQTALYAAADGITLCINTVIPSLFPFIILSGIITASFTGSNMPLMRPLGKVCSIPKGCETLLLLSWLGGYPTGAKCVYQSWKNGQLSKLDAERLLGFCNNAGPAFIFGVVSVIFDSASIAWILWGIHIISSVIAGILLSAKPEDSSNIGAPKQVVFTQLVADSIKSMAIISGWIVIARIIIGYIDHWFSARISATILAGVAGLLELSNGCLMLSMIPSERVKFIMCGSILAFGGLCVWMQTASVTGELSKKFSIVGCILKTIISFSLSGILSLLIYP